MQRDRDGLVYADATALSRALLPGPESVAWLRFAAENAHRLVTSELGITELRRLTVGMDPVARAKAWEIQDHIEVVRLSDQALEVAALASAAAPPYTALHVGTAVSDTRIEAVATYDPLLARVCDIYSVVVVSPGRSDGWWL